MCSNLYLSEGNVTHQRHKRDNSSEIETEIEVMPETITYMCGTGLITSWLSKNLARPCGTSMLNNCCLDHDVCYDDPKTDQEKCDNDFCNCISKSYSKSKYCERWLTLTHCAPVKALGYFPLISARKISTREQFIDGIKEIKKNENSYPNEVKKINFTEREYVVKT
uniref:Phospholipase A(2) n=1 Tax=Strongyloides venezuelensis TaxID=75913 RepID=A0A0K0FYY5_STRVS